MTFLMNAKRSLQSSVDYDDFNRRGNSVGDFEK